MNLFIIIVLAIMVGTWIIKRLDNSPKPRREFYWRYGKRAKADKVEQLIKQNRRDGL